MSDWITPEERKRFIREWLLRGNVNEAALIAFANRNAGEACSLGDKLSRDETALAERDAIIATEGKAAFLPDKEDVARKVLDIVAERAADGSGSTFKHSARDRLFGLRLYSEIRGYVERNSKDAPPVNTPDAMAEIANMLPD